MVQQDTPTKEPIGSMDCRWGRNSWKWSNSPMETTGSSSPCYQTSTSRNTGRAMKVSLFQFVNEGALVDSGLNINNSGLIQKQAHFHSTFTIL
jgi:hypothetical protein